MSDKDQLIKEKLDHTGIFDFSALYGFAHSWLKEEGYSVKEEKYSEKVAGDARNITFEWKASRNFSDYFKIELAIKGDIGDLKEVEVEIEGKKKQMNKGKVAFEIKGSLVTDYSSKWETNAWTRFLRGWYNKYIIPARVDSMEGKVVGDTTTFKEELKAYLELLGRR